MLQPRAILMLGAIALHTYLRMMVRRGHIASRAAYKFAHGAEFTVGDLARLFVSYHPSQQNTQTGRLTPAMLDEITSPTDETSGDEFQALREAIDRLPSPQRQVVLMHYLEESSIRDVAALLSVSEKTIEGRLYQARRTLRRLLEGKLQENFTAPQIARMLLCL